MSAKALEILKAKMSLEERQQFVANCNKQNPEWEKNIDGKMLGTGGIGLFHSTVSFRLLSSKEGFEYWQSIYLRFTDEELSTRINLKE
jgi:hypothetical protein